MLEYQLPVETAEQLGLHQLAPRKHWQQAADPKKTDALKVLATPASTTDNPVVR